MAKQTRKKVLIAYGTRSGSTQEVASQIEIFLKNEGLDVQLADLKKSSPEIDEFDGVVVGASIRVGSWMSEPKRFLEKNKEKLKEKYLGVFVSCATAIGDKEKARKDYLEDVSEKMELEFDVYDAFPGVLDFSKESKLGFFTKRILKSVMKKKGEEEGMELDMEGRNDFRDWNQVKAFAKKFANLIKS